jgi:predicted ATPase
MYIKSIDIKNIRSIEHFHWELDKDADDLAGWHVLIGDNGSGKSTVLRAIALTLIGVKDASGLRQNWEDWLAHKYTEGSVSLSLVDDEQLDNFTKSGIIGKKKNLAAGLSFKRNNLGIVEIDALKIGSNPATDRHVWGGGKGWFSTSYGPFRRFTGGNAENTRIFLSNPRLAAHLSVFGEDVALTEALSWLRELNYKRLEKRQEGDLLEPIKAFINQVGFLPQQAKLMEISSSGVIFDDANDNPVSVEKLSDGFRSILSMTFELIRQLQIAYPNEKIFSEDNTQVILPGVVLVDEIDAHLHPEWQRTIGYWLIKLFPNIQFIVTTHSPLVCQAAVHGSIWRLPAPGSDEQAHQITPDSEDWKRLVYGNILEAYSTDLFGENINRSREAQDKFKKLSELSVKEMEEPLSPEEEKLQRKLIEELPNVPSRELILMEQGKGDKLDD